ncbi:MAG: hypothetical protein OK454_04525 [Thaumarchaeota archaeon]|nr:hypothetical protein [Nitrososphaerota archaeon]
MKFDGRATDALTERPACDLCGEPAIVDGATQGGPWGYLCAAHFGERGVGLGLGLGQILLCQDDFDPVLIGALMLL